MIDKLDGRCRAARRFKALYGAFAADLGGEAALTAAERSLVRQAAAMTMRGEDLQNAILRGEIVDDDALVRLSNASARLLSALGVQRRSRQPAAVAPWESK